MKKAFVVAAVALLAVAAQAGEIKYHEWPCAPIAQEITTIPVIMDVGYWVKITDQDKLVIELSQDSIHTYSGCCNMAVTTNTALTFSASISKTAVGGVVVVPGDYSAWCSPANVASGSSTVAACAKITDADLSNVPGGSKDVNVATVTIKVVPTSI
jgi:hypothetical protein